MHWLGLRVGIVLVVVVLVLHQLVPLVALVVHHHLVAERVLGPPAFAP